MKKTKLILSALFLVMGLVATASEELPSIPEICYDTVEGTQFCTTDNEGNVKVFVYNAGWCPPCNSEMSELSDMYPEFEGKKVTFASLSGEGFARGSKPDQAFLKAWKKKHSIPDGFVVAGKYKDFGKAFGASGSIPFAVVLDQSGNKVAGGFLSASSIGNKVRSLLKHED